MLGYDEEDTGACLTIEEFTHYLEEHACLEAVRRKRKSHRPNREQRWRQLFEAIDGNHDGRLTRLEFIMAIRKQPELAHELHDLLGMPEHIRQEDGTRDLFVRAFESMDEDQSGTIEMDEFVSYLQKVAASHVEERRRLSAIQEEAETAIPTGSPLLRSLNSAYSSPGTAGGGGAFGGFSPPSRGAPSPPKSIKVRSVGFASSASSSTKKKRKQQQQQANPPPMPEPLLLTDSPGKSPGNKPATAATSPTEMGSASTASASATSPLSADGAASPGDGGGGGTDPDTPASSSSPSSAASSSPSAASASASASASSPAVPPAAAEEPSSEFASAAASMFAMPTSDDEDDEAEKRAEAEEERKKKEAAAAKKDDSDSDLDMDDLAKEMEETPGDL